MKKIALAITSTILLCVAFTATSQAAPTMACSPDAPCAPAAFINDPDLGDPFVPASGPCSDHQGLLYTVQHVENGVAVSYHICADGTVERVPEGGNGVYQPAADDGVYHPGTDAAPETNPGLYEYDYATDTFEQREGC